MRIRQSVLRQVKIEVPRFSRQVHRLERTATFLMHNIQALHETQVIAHLCISAGATTFIEVTAESGSTNRCENNMISANLQLVFGVPRPKSKLRRRQRQFLLNEIAIEAHHHAVFIDVGARKRELLATACLEET